MYLFGMWQKKNKQRYFGERMGKQTAAHTQSFRNRVFSETPQEKYHYNILFNL